MRQRTQGAYLVEDTSFNSILFICLRYDQNDFILLLWKLSNDPGQFYINLCTKPLILEINKRTIFVVTTTYNILILSVENTNKV